MAWDTDATRGRLIDAATEEFTEHGPDATTMTAIAARAGINKERLYNYYGDKRALFSTVLGRELSRLASSVAPPAGGLEDVGEFAARTFDYYGDHPGLARLLLWEGLAGAPPAMESERTVRYRDKTAAFALAQQDGILADEVDPAHLLFLIIGLAAWWFAVPQLAAMITGGPDDHPTERARRRASVVRAAQRLAQNPAPPPNDTERTR